MINLRLSLEMTKGNAFGAIPFGTIYNFHKYTVAREQAPRYFRKAFLEGLR